MYVGEPVDRQRLDRSTGPGRFANALLGSVPFASQRHRPKASASFDDGSVEDSGDGEVGGAVIEIAGALDDRWPLTRLGLDTACGGAGGALNVPDLVGEPFFA